MLTLILLRLCGIGHIVKRCAWSMLGICVMYAGSAVMIHSVSHASNTTVLYDAFTALQVLQYHDQYDGLFDGNNGLVFTLLQEEYKDGDDIASYSRFVEGFDAIDSSFRSGYNIDKKEIMIVLRAVEIVATKTLGENGNYGNTLDGKLPYGYVMKTFNKDQGTLVTFETQENTLPKRMNWYFGDGTQYSCEREQCRRLNHMYADQGKYTIDIYSSMRLHSPEKTRFSIMVE